MAKQTAILELQVDPSDLLKDAAASKKAILDLKDEQNDLNKAFKAGTIDVNKYIQETVKLEQRLKREQDTYKNLTQAINTQSGSLDAQRLKLQQLTKERNALDQTTKKGIDRAKELTGEIKALNDAISKQEQAGGDFRRNVGNYGNAFKEAAGNISVAGVSVNDFTGKILSLANPLTAAAGLLTGLASAYARSTSGAKDLEFAQNQLAAATTIVSNKFADLISSQEEGEGIFAKITETIIASVAGIDSAIMARVSASNLEALEDLQIQELELRDKVNDRLERNEEIMTELRGDQVDYNEKIGLTNEAITNLTDNQESLTNNLREQLSILEFQKKILGETDEIKRQIAQTTLDISKIDKDTKKRIEAIQRIEQDLTEEYKKQQAELAKINKLTRRSGTVAGVSGTTSEEISANLQSVGQGPIDITKTIEQAKTKIEKEESEKRTRQAGEEFRAKARWREMELDNFQKTIAVTQGIFEEGSAAYKALATTQALIDTYRGATAALAPPPTGAGPVFGPILAAATIAAGLANISKINGFAEGGWTGPGDKYKPVGIVHADEYVTPKHIVNSPAAQPHIAALERMRTMPGYADGGFVTNQNTAAANQNLALMSMVKNLPAPILDVREAVSVQDRIEKRKSVVKLGSK